jgi:hypothetical protein
MCHRFACVSTALSRSQYPDPQLFSLSSGVAMDLFIDLWMAFFISLAFGLPFAISK